MAGRLAFAAAMAQIDVPLPVSLVLEFSGI